MLREQGSAQGEFSSASPIAEQAVVTQPGEAAREHVQEEASDELAGVEAHHLALVAVGVVAPAESHLLGVEVDEAVVGDGAYARPRQQIVDAIVRATRKPVRVGGGATLDRTAATRKTDSRADLNGLLNQSMNFTL